MTNMSWCLVTNINISPLLLLGLKTPVVAFTSMLSKDTTIGPRAILKYDIVVTNWGGAYRPTTGIFTVPYDGLYSISCTLMSHPSNYVHLTMMKNGQSISLVFSNFNTFPQVSQILLSWTKGTGFGCRITITKLQKFMIGKFIMYFPVFWLKILNFEK